jgi:hypothetical protein
MRQGKKYCNHEMTYALLNEHIEVDIKYQEDRDTFKIWYLHPSNPKYYVCFAIAIKNFHEIRLVTTHPERRKNEEHY